MAPTTANVSPSVPQGVSAGPRSSQTVHIAGSPMNASVGGSSTTQKLTTGNISTNHNVHLVSSTSTQKLSTAGISTRTSINIVGRSSTTKAAVVGESTLRSNPPSVQVTSAVVSSSTTRRIPVISGQSPGGIHSNYSTRLPAISQGQHGTTNGGGESTNTSAIIAGVLVPLILVGVGALIFYVWYRRKYPVRMVLGRDFNRFSNPAYNKRASTLTLVRNDGQNEWDTLSRRNPDLSAVTEEEPSGIENRAFESEENEHSNDSVAEKRTKVNMESSAVDVRKKDDQEEIVPNVGINRERPKTKKAVLVKTDTMEDFENGFELVTESDLGQRTESEVSSGNDSTETHTISLTFSDTFDDRHKENRTQPDIVGDMVVNLDANGSNNNDFIDASETETDNDSSMNNLDGANGEYETTGKIQVINENELNGKDLGFQNNESFELISDEQVDDRLKVLQNKTDLGNGEDTAKLSSTLWAEETIENERCEEYVEEDTQTNNENADRASMNKVKDLSENTNEYIKHQDCFALLQTNENEKTVDRIVESIGLNSAESLGDVIKTESNADTTSFDSFGHESSFEILSESGEVKTEIVNFMRDSDGCRDDMAEDNMNILEKEKTEILEKQKLLEESSNLLSIVDTGNKHSEGMANETDLQKTFPQTKIPSLTLSNENIVLDSVPPTPTVFVQESFILENESPLPVYLDSTPISPGRGRRAFTLNDIASKQDPNDAVSSEFSLPKEKYQISKSSPVISELKTPEFKRFGNKFFDSENISDKHTDIQGEYIKGSGDKVNNSKINAFEKYAEKDNTQKHFLSSSDTCKAVEIDTRQDIPSVSDAFGSPESYELENGIPSEKSPPMESDEIITSLDSESFEIYSDKSNDLDLNIVIENNNFNEIAANSFNLIQTDIKPDEKLEREMSRSTNEGDTLDTLNLFTSNLTADVTFEHASTQSENKANDKEEITPNDIFEEDNPFFSNFPQSSTPTASVVAMATTDSNNDSKRKKVLPQTFDFEDSGTSDSDSTNSETTSKPSEVGVTNITSSSEILGENNKSDDTFGTDALKTLDQTAYSFDTTQHKEDFFMPDDMVNLTASTDSSTALSWELLSRENSQDSRSYNPFDSLNKGKNAPSELLDFSGHKNQNNEADSVLNLQTEKTGMPDINFDITNQSSSKNTGMGSYGKADVAWEMVIEGADNSEC